MTLVRVFAPPYVRVLISLLALVSFSVGYAFSQQSSPQPPAAPAAPAVVTHSPAPPAPPSASAPTRSFTPNEVQTLKLKLAKDEALLARASAQFAEQQARDAEQKAQDALKAYQKQADDIRAENHWPENLQYDFDRMVYSEPSQPTTAAPREPRKP